MIARLAAVSYAVAGALVVVALVLLVPSAAAMFGAGAAQTSLPPWYLIGHAVTLAAYVRIVAAADKLSALSIGSIIASGVLGIFLATIAVIDAALAVESLLQWPAVNPWIVLLLIPGLVAGAAFFAYFDAKEVSEFEPESDSEAEFESESDDEAPVAAREGAPAPLKTLIAETRTGVITACIGIAVIFVLGIGFVLYEALRGTLFDGAVFNMVRLLGFARDVGIRVVPGLIALAVVLPLGYFVIGAGKSISQVWTRLRGGRSDRDLSDAEMDFIDEADVALERYAEAQGFKRLDNWLFAASFGGVALMWAVLWISIWHRQDVATLYAPPPAAPGWHLINYPFAGSALPGMFLCLLLFWPLRSAFAFRSRRLSELVTWYTYSSSRGSWKLRAELVRQVRTGRLRVTKSFKPGDFLHQINLDWAPFAFASCGLLALGTVILWDRDQRDYTMFTDNGVDVAAYWSGRVQHYPYSAFDHVDLTCAPTKNDFEAEYWIDTREGDSIELVQQKELVTRLADYELVDRKLIDAGVRFEFSKRRPRIPPFVGYSAECVRWLTKDLDGDSAARVERLFHFGDWQAGHGAGPQQ